MTIFIELSLPTFLLQREDVALKCHLRSPTVGQITTLNRAKRIHLPEAVQRAATKRILP
ncbi:MAG: hypothetical protein V7K64_04450 [Nostoc sp.]|uniref:hypothetical protein n=1 Tax=unclassified Nostoc TaxID=2593658 RepID=UPI001E1242D1|nr:hypothetical protein [Nostoc sp. JL34]MBN3885296.1 hypothetical protein [Nostoc sp. JL34]